MKVTLKLKPLKKILGERGIDRTGQMVLTSEVRRVSDPYVPFEDGPLKNTARVEPKKLTYVQPYAKKQYYENKGSGLRGKDWVGRAMVDRLMEVLNTVAHFVGGRVK